MFAAISHFLQEVNVSMFLNFLVSCGVGILSFSAAFFLKKKRIKGAWFTVLRYILILLATAGIGNAYSMALLGYHKIEPTELILNAAMLSFLVWIACYGIFVKHCTPASIVDKILKSIHVHVPGLERDEVDAKR